MVGLVDEHGNAAVRQRRDSAEVRLVAGGERKAGFAAEEVRQQLDLNLPWHTRRANVLIAGTTLGHWIGRTVRLGEIEVEIEAETEPCELMDIIQPGLRKALVPDCRAGVYGRVRRGGVLRVGEPVELLDE